MRSVVVKKLAVNALYFAAVIGIVLGVWAIGAYVADSEFVLPDIPTTFSALGNVFALPVFWSALGRTMLRCVISYAISVAMAGGLFFVCSISVPVSRIVKPIVSALRTLPTMAVSLLLAIWAGANAAPVILGVLVVMPMLFSALVARTATLPTELIETARLFGAGRARVFGSVTLPYAASSLPESLSTAFSFGVKIVIAAEILMQTAGSLGMLMFLSQAWLQTAMLIAYVFIAVVLSVLSEYVIRAILRAALKKFEGY